MSLLWQAVGGDAQAFLAAADALLKVVLFDMGLALETCFAADARELAAAEARYGATLGQGGGGRSPFVVLTAPPGCCCATPMRPPPGHLWRLRAVLPRGDECAR